MLAFLVLHLAQHGRLVATSQYRKLAGVDAGRAIFPGMIHAKHAGHARLRLRISGQTASCLAHATLLSRQRNKASSTANASAYSRFIAAMETGRPGIR